MVVFGAGGGNVDDDGGGVAAVAEVVGGGGGNRDDTKARVTEATGARTFDCCSRTAGVACAHA